MLRQFSSFYINSTYVPNMMNRICLIIDSFSTYKKYICLLLKCRVYHHPLGRNIVPVLAMDSSHSPSCRVQHCTPVLGPSHLETWTPVPTQTMISITIMKSDILKIWRLQSSRIWGYIVWEIGYLKGTCSLSLHDRRWRQEGLMAVNMKITIIWDVT
jgi:hypothetical protein